ncbi:zinc finger, CCHC-type containing protein, partial [Tanacetum coccineum]
MGDENPICTLGDYSKPSHEGYRNTIELPEGTTWYLFDPTPSDSLDLDSENMDRTCLCLFQFSLRDQASNWLERLPAGSITTWEDLTTHFLAQFFPPGRTAKLRNDILMFQQHHGESLSEAWTRFKDLLQKSLIMASIVGFRSKFFMILLSSTHIPQAYAKAVYSNPHPQNQNKPLKQNPFTFRECTSPNPQPQALGTIFEARVQDYMAAHTKRMERFENTIFKQHEEINDKMTKMFEHLKELMTSRAPEKVLIIEEAKFPVTKNVNSISLPIWEEERSKKADVMTGDDIEKPTKTETEMLVKESEKEDEAKSEPNRKAGKEEAT